MHISLSLILLVDSVESRFRDSWRRKSESREFGLVGGFSQLHARHSLVFRVPFFGGVRQLCGSERFRITRSICPYCFRLGRAPTLRNTRVDPNSRWYHQATLDQHDRFVFANSFFWDLKISPKNKSEQCSMDIPKVLMMQLTIASE